MSNPIIYKPSGRAGEYANHGYAANLYTGCPNGCAYCFAPDCLHMKREDFHREAKPKKDVLDRLFKDCQGKHFEEPVFLCFSCDPYPSIEEELQITRRAIEIIKDSGNNVRILTKNGFLPQRDFGLLGDGDEFGMTLTCADGERSLLWEPQASPYARRRDTLELAHSLYIKTWVSCEPVIYPDDTFQIIEECAPFVDMFKIGILNYAGKLPARLFEELPKVDWAKFGREAVDLCERLGVNYYVKQDLRKYMEVTG